MFYLVGTPIGNTGDLSPRAVEVLSSVDVIACEDTRRTGLLLSSFGISSKLMSYHEHNKASKNGSIIKLLEEGNDVALVSDAGMPCINDPGEDIVKLVIEHGLELTCIPGPSAAITALCLSGLSSATFHYEGFLPSENSPRKKRLRELAGIRETIIIYEAPHRLRKLIGELIDNGFGDCRAAFCREMTKKFEEVLRFTVFEADRYFAANEPRGEFVICLSPQEDERRIMSEEELADAARKLLDEGIPTKEAASRLAEMTGRNKKEMYNYLINLI